MGEKVLPCGRQEYCRPCRYVDEETQAEVCSAVAQIAVQEGLGLRKPERLPELAAELIKDDGVDTRFRRQAVAESAMEILTMKTV